MLQESALLSFVASLLSIMNPLGNAGIFATVTADQSDKRARRTALMCAVAVAVTLLIVTWAGTAVLAFFGITVNALRVAGGLIVLLIGLHMLFNKSEHKQSSDEADDAQARDSVAVVPMAIPIVAGPGTMAAVLVAAQQHHSVLSKAEMSIVVVVLSALTGAVFAFAKPIAEWLGASGMGVITRVMGMILASIAVGMLSDGLKALMPGLAG
ncbi:MAG: MarC family protein [Planctomycetota bacterium]